MKNTARTFFTVTAIAVAAAGFSGCAAGNSYLAHRSTTVEMYHIFDIKTRADTGVVSKAVADGLAQNTGTISQITPLQIGKSVPAEPGRFRIDNTRDKLAGTGMGALIDIIGSRTGEKSMKRANCDDAVWHSRAERSITGSSNLVLHSCLYKYQQGYNLDVYAVFEKIEGGLGRVLQGPVESLVGSPEQWVNKTILDTVRSIELVTGSKVVRLEGQPELTEMPTGLIVGGN